MKKRGNESPVASTGTVCIVVEKNVWADTVRKIEMRANESDGKFIPEQVKEHYKARGYSILGLTDRLYMRDRSVLNDENFVALSGYENNIHDGKPANADKAYHHLPPTTIITIPWTVSAALTSCIRARSITKAYRMPEKRIFPM